MQGRSGRLLVVARRRGGRETRLARSGIREHAAFLGHELKGPAGTGSGGVSMAGGWQDQGAGKGDGVRDHRLSSPLFFCLRMYFCILSFCLDKGGC